MDNITMARVLNQQHYLEDNEKSAADKKISAMVWGVVLMFVVSGIYACYVNEIVRHHYMQKGWVEEQEPSPEEKQDTPNQAQE
jgi:hypothetical protein